MVHTQFVESTKWGFDLPQSCQTLVIRVMHIIDLIIFIAYMIAMLGVGFYFLKKNKDAEDYYVGSRNMGSWHVGLSVVATDVGGGFSIGLGGLGFTMGLSGSWMLFTGLIGAWMTVVWLIPNVFELGQRKKFITFPQLFEHFFSPQVALLAGIISAVGYIGFTSSQILAGAKLAAATFDGLSLQTALWVMGAIAVVYTVMGGIKAVIYTDTVQWGILMGGLIFIGIPMSYQAVGGYDAIAEALPPDMLSLTNISLIDIVNWTVTIIPMWFVAMTLYQRIYSCRSEAEAKKAWMIAGFFEWPIMAFMGVLLGLFAKVALMQGILDAPDTLDAEMGLPLLLKTVLPVGLMGLMMSAYFSAIMSTADSCLMAASGNVVTDIIERLFKIDEKTALRFSQIATLCIGFLAITLASFMTNVLELMLFSYAFMVSGLLVPVIGAIVFKQKSATAAFWAMLVGGVTTLSLQISAMELPAGLDANIFGLTAATVVFWVVAKLDKE